MIAATTNVGQLDALCALFRSCRDQEPADHLTIRAALETIRAPSPEVADLVARVRAETDKQKRNLLKQHLPAVTFAADLRSRAKELSLAEKVISTTNLCCLDFDEISAGLADFKDALANDPRVLSVFYSPSGNGLKCLIAVDSSRFLECWRTASAYFQEKYSLKCDQSCKDITRLCYVSHDENIYIADHEVEPFLPLEVEAPPPEVGQLAPANRNATSTIHRARAYLVAMPASIQDHHGSDSLFAAACALEHGFSMADYEALPLLAEYNRRSVPAWDQAELYRKLLESARVPHDRPRGWLLDAPGAVPAASADPTQPSEGIVVRTHADRMRERLNPPEMIVDGLLPAGGIGAIIALPGVGKTLVSVELSRCIASGEPFAGRAVRRGMVIYACQDSPASTERRMLAIPEDIAKNILTICDLPRLPDGLPGLRATIAALHAESAVSAVVIDTWDSAREHSSGGYADIDGGCELILSGLRTLAGELGIAVSVVHHATRADASRARGTVVFDARCDWIAVAEQTPGGISLRSIKCRDGEIGPVGRWRVVAVPVGERSVPTLVADDGRSAPKTGLSQNAKCLLASLAGWDGPLTPSRAQLAERSGLPEGSLTRTLGQLRDAGFVEPDSLRVTEAGQGLAVGVLL